MRRAAAVSMLVAASALSCGCTMRHTFAREAIQAQEITPMGGWGARSRPHAVLPAGPARGSSTVNVAPAPIALSTRIDPPSASTMERAM